MELSDVDINYDVQTDSRGKDPDGYSMTLKNIISYYGVKSCLMDNQ